MAIKSMMMAIGFNPPPEDFMSVPTFLEPAFLGFEGSTCRRKREIKRERERETERER